MIRIGTISYNIYCNFTNYGSALQTWALHQAIKKTGNIPILVDYCPDVLLDKNPLTPYKNMWDKDPVSKYMCKLSMPAIEKNYLKFMKFYNENFQKTSVRYTSDNFAHINKEKLDGYVCGSDTIFCIEEFGGFDNGYFANYSEMKGRSVSYAASFGDSHFTKKDLETLIIRCGNFKALGIRENKMIPYLQANLSMPIQRTIDPTLLLTQEDYNEIIYKKIYNEKYILLYSRRYSPEMEKYAEKLAREKGWIIIEISLRAINAKRGHIMFYEAGVEEFLSLVKNAEYIVTNSFHGMIFSVQFRRPFVVFSREQCENKIFETLKLLGIEKRILLTGEEQIGEIDYDMIHERIKNERTASFNFLKKELMILEGNPDVS